MGPLFFRGDTRSPYTHKKEEPEGREWGAEQLAGTSVGNFSTALRHYPSVKGCFSGAALKSEIKAEDADSCAGFPARGSQDQKDFAESRYVRLKRQLERDMVR